MTDGIDIFGLQAHDDRHSETERLLRRVVEQVAQLSIDLGITRTELRRVALDLNELRESKVSSADIDPAFVEFNEKVKEARIRLDDTRDAAAAEWERSQGELFAALEELNASLED